MYYKIEDVVIEIDDDVVSLVVDGNWKILRGNKNQYVYSGKMVYLHHVIAKHYFSTYAKSKHRVKFVDGNIYNFKRSNIKLLPKTSNTPYIHKVLGGYNVSIRNVFTSTTVETFDEAKLVLATYISDNSNIIYNQLFTIKIDTTTFSNSRQYTYLIKFSDLFDELEVTFPIKLLQLRDNYIKLVQVFEELNKEIP